VSPRVPGFGVSRAAAIAVGGGAIGAAQDTMADRIETIDFPLPEALHDILITLDHALL
jgi:hypothetical protein